MYLVYPKRNALRVMLHCQRFVPDLDVFAVVNIALSIVMTITNKDSEAMTTMGKLRSSCFLMGIIFLVFSVVLKVG